MAIRLCACVNVQDDENLVVWDKKSNVYIKRREEEEEGKGEEEEGTKMPP